MPIIYLILLSLAALAVSVVGAFFSVTGLAKLFAGAPIAVMAMAGSLEFAKIVAAAFLHRAWGDLNMLLRWYLTGAVAVLVAITSMGIFGYLSHAYQATSEQLKRVEVKLLSIDSRGQDIQKELQRLQTMMNLIPTTRLTKRLEAQKEIEPRINELNDQAYKNKEEQRDLHMQQLSLQTEIGPLVYLAQATGREPDHVARWVITLFVSVFDPLAICLVICVSFGMKLRATEREKKKREELEQKLALERAAAEARAKAAMAATLDINNPEHPAHAAHVAAAAAAAAAATQTPVTSPALSTEPQKADVA